jgi:hypothetical protein
MPSIYICTTDNYIQKIYYTSSKSTEEYYDKSIDFYLNDRQLRFYCISLLLRCKSKWVFKHVHSVLNNKKVNITKENIFYSYADAQKFLKNVIIQEIIE